MTKELIEEISDLECSSCGKSINKVWVCKLEVPKITRYVFFCTNCQRCLGVSDNKNPKSLTRSPDNLPPAQLQF